MSLRTIPIASVLALLLVTAARADGDSGSVVVTPHEVRVGLFYSGRDVVVCATIPRVDDVAIRISGVPGDVTLKRMGRKVGLIWMNVGEIHYEDVPTLYLLRSTRPLAEIASSGELERFGIGYDALRGRVPPGPEHGRELFGDFTRLRERDGLFHVESDGVSADARDDGRMEVSSRFFLPANAPVGEYSVEVFGFRGGRGERLGTTHLQLCRGPAVSFLTSMATGHGLMYGCLAVVLAVLVGLLTGILFSKGQGGAH